MQLETHTVADSYRPDSEDRVAVLDASSGIVIAVADGMGGRAGGGEAASAFISLVVEAAAALRNVADADEWDALLVRADRAIRDNRLAGETTAVVVGVGARAIGGASVGDSGAWFITPDRMFDLTAAQQRKPGPGTGMASPTPFRARVVTGTLLVATDGLFKYAGAEQISAVVRAEPVATACRSLVELVRLPRGGLQDDLAIALCRLG
jgi:serine/threonine protein phosphatase PrpC